MMVGPPGLSMHQLASYTCTAAAAAALMLPGCSRVYARGSMTVPGGCSASSQPHSATHASWLSTIGCRVPPQDRGLGGRGGGLGGGGGGAGGGCGGRGGLGGLGGGGEGATWKLQSQHLSGPVPW